MGKHLPEDAKEIMKNINQYSWHESNFAISQIQSSNTNHSAITQVEYIKK
jgi:hypothetical protein